MPIITRTGKGSPLTHAELDGNFQYIQDHSNLENLLAITGHPQYTLTADMTRYSVTSHTHLYLPLSGGTVTGKTYFTGGLSATTLSGDGSALVALTADDTDRFNAKLPQEYSLTGHTHNYLPLSGGTLTGETYFTDGLSGNSISGVFIGDGSALVALTADDTTLFNTKLPQEYSLTGHTHNYLPLSGGTVTDDTYFSKGLSAFANKQVQVANGGATRPGSPVDYEMFFDTDIGKPI